MKKNNIFSYFLFAQQYNVNNFINTISTIAINLVRKPLHWRVLSNSNACFADCFLIIFDRVNTAKVKYSH